MKRIGEPTEQGKAAGKGAGKTAANGGALSATGRTTAAPGQPSGQ
jgi:hypothetical protein